MSPSRRPDPRQVAAATSMSEVRRLIGPTAWCVLEVLVARAEPASLDGCVVASVRSIATEIGVSKNTAARALIVLRRAGLLRIERQERSSGRFGPGRYVLPTIHRALDEIVDSTIPSPAPNGEGDDEHHRPVKAATASPEQLSLLPNH